MREPLAQVASRILDERWLMLLIAFHVVGVHLLAGSRRWWTKLPAAVCLVGASACWVKATGLSPGILGVNAATLGAFGGLLVLGGLWLFLGGSGHPEWLAGFTLASAGAAFSLYSAGQRWAAASCLALAVPLSGAWFWFARWGARTDPQATSMGERVVSMTAVGLFAGVTALAATAPSDASVLAIQGPTRLRDFVTQPAILLLLVVGGVFSLAVSVRLWPRLDAQ